MLKEYYPNAYFYMNIGRASSFEILLNDHTIHSKLNGDGFVNDFKNLNKKIS